MSGLDTLRFQKIKGYPLIFWDVDQRWSNFFERPWILSTLDKGSQSKTAASASPGLSKIIFVVYGESYEAKTEHRTVMTCSECWEGWFLHERLLVDPDALQAGSLSAFRGVKREFNAHPCVFMLKRALAQLQVWMRTVQFFVCTSDVWDHFCFLGAWGRFCKRSKDIL